MRGSRAFALGAVVAALTIAVGSEDARSSTPAGFVSTEFEPSIDPVRPVILGGVIRYVGPSRRVRIQGPVRLLRGGRELAPSDGVVAIRARDTLESTGTEGDFSLAPVTTRNAIAVPIVGRTIVPRVVGRGTDEPSACPYAPSLDDVGDETSVVSIDSRLDDVSAFLVTRTPDGRARDRRALTSRRSTVRVIADRALRPDGDAMENLVVGLGDSLELEADVNGALTARLVVGGGRCSPRTIRLEIHVVTPEAGAPSPAGITRAAADENVGAMLDDTNRALAVCGIAIAPANPRFRIVAPPSPYLVAIADGDGLPTRSASTLTLRVDARRVTASIPANSLPVATATLFAAAVRDAGFDATILALPRLDRAAHPAADVLVRRRNGELTRISPMADLPLLGDVQQPVRIGRVDFADGLDAMDSDRAATGTVEERTLLGSVVDSDPGSIDVVVIESFGDPSRMGEAFVARDGSPWAGTVVLTRNAIDFHATILTLAHEIAHLLLDDPYHPTSTSVGRFERITASASNRDASTPKTFVRDECERMRRQGTRYFALP